MTEIEECFTRQLYKKAADSFLQTLGKIKNNPERSKKRLIWELIQNAKDVKNKFGKVSIRIILTDNALEFQHNGDPFSLSDFIGLVQQTSSKDSQNAEGQTGKFGTGFVSTYLLSDIIDICGVANIEGRFRRFTATLDRSAQTSEELAKCFIYDAKLVDNIFSNADKGDWVADYESRREDQFDTCFTYRLVTEGRKLYAKAGVEDLVNTLPLTLVNQPSIRSVEVISDGMAVRYSCDQEEVDNGVPHHVKVLINRNGEDDVRWFYTFRKDGVRLTVETDVGGKNIIPTMPETPKLLRDFPLIGSNMFYFPYYLNGEHFYPTEDRDGLYLNGALENNLPAISNRTILETAVEIAIEFNEWLIDKRVGNLWSLASSRKPEADMQGETKEWFNSLQTKWRQAILKQALFVGITDPMPVSRLCLPFAVERKVSPEAADSKFLAIVRPIRLPLRDWNNVLPRNDEDYANWVTIIEQERETWGDVAFEYTLEGILRDISQLGSITELRRHSGLSEDLVYNWLEQLYVLVLCVQERTDIAWFEKYNIIPSADGQFRRASELKTDFIAPVV